MPCSPRKRWRSSHQCRSFAAPDWWYLAVDALPSAAFIDWFDGQLARLCASSSTP
jgi:tetraacyldisaccharide 4'-kinase